MRAARHAGIITGLPDAYGRGRIIGDYRRVPLYGVNRLILQKQKDKADLGKNPLTADTIRLSEEVTDQITALKDMVKMAAMYGYDITARQKTPARLCSALFRISRRHQRTERCCHESRPHLHIP